MKISLLLIAGNDEQFAAAAVEAANAAFPGATTGRANSLKEALETGGSCGPQILVMIGAREAEVIEAVQALDDFKLPRWAVVASGKSAPVTFAEVVVDAEWKPGLLVRVLRSSLALHLMRRDRERLLGDLLSIGTRITHDLRTPLGGILVATEAMKESHAGSPETSGALAQPITESVRDLVKIIGQLTLLAKASAKPDIRQPFNMGEPVRRAMQRIEVMAAGQGVTVSHPASWPDVTADPSKTESIWHGLLENVLLHAGKGTKIELGWEREGEGCRFWVRDNGKGVPPEKRRSLFQPFHRLHEPSAVRGLGLPIVERLVNIQGGRCGYEPCATGGSYFFFSMPLAGTR